MKTLSIVIAILFIATLTVHSQPAMNRQSGLVPDFDPKGISNVNTNGQNTHHPYSTRLDSMKQELQAHQKRIHSKKTVLSTGEITVDITQTWSSGVWVNSSLDSIITNSYGEQL